MTVNASTASVAVRLNNVQTNLGTPTCRPERGGKRSVRRGCARWSSCSVAVSSDSSRSCRPERLAWIRSSAVEKAWVSTDVVDCTSGGRTGGGERAREVGKERDVVGGAGMGSGRLGPWNEERYGGGWIGW